MSYLNGTTGSKKTLDDILTDSERLYILQKLINLRQGKGTRSDDQIPLRALGPAFLNEYRSRADYYDEWLRGQLADDIPDDEEEKHRLLVEKRLAAYQQLCDIVYRKKGFTPDALPKRETVRKAGLLDAQADKLLSKFGL